MELVFFVFWLLFRVAVATTDVASCSCGFFDPRTGAVWTDAIVTYANETDALPAESLVAEDFQHANEKNWNARYRAGASSSNLGHNESTGPGWNGSAWTLKLDTPTKDHAVVGASIRSLRRDIRYGTFESALGAPKPGVGGSVLAMRLDYNESQTVNLNVMNADDPKEAWTSFMIYGDWRGTRSKGVNFSDFGNSTYKFPSSPWGFVPYRIDWTDAKADFFIGESLARSISPRDTWKRWPTTPSTLYFRHSSIGDMYTSQGPPPNGSYAHVGMIRAFFNSSLMSDADHTAYDKRCRQGSDHVPSSPVGKQCFVSDTSLRGSSPYSPAATTKFKENLLDYKKRWPAIFVASICISISTVLLVHALIKRAPWRKTKAAAPANGHGDGAVASATADSSRRTSKDLSITPSMIFSEGHGLTHAAQFPGTGTPGAVTPGTVTPSRGGTPRASMLHLASSDFTPAWSEAGTLVGGGGYFSRAVSSAASPAVTPGVNYANDSRPGTRPGSSSLQIPSLPTGITVHRRNESDENTIASSGISLKKHGLSPLRDSDIRSSLEISAIEEKKQMGRFVEGIDQKKFPEVHVKEIEMKSNGVAGAPAGAKPPIAAPKQRVDYLAGLVSNFVTFLKSVD